MSELPKEITQEVKDFLDSDHPDIYRCISRTAILHVDESTDVRIEQVKILSDREASQVLRDGPGSLATPSWFNDVEWIQHPDDVDTIDPTRSLFLEAVYPIAYFDTRPVSGRFSGSDWLEQYGSISGFGNDEITTWALDFVDSETRTVVRQIYPKDPTAVDRYNAKYGQYLQRLTDSTPALNYYRGWNRLSQQNSRKQLLQIGGLSLVGFALNEAIDRGMQVLDDEFSGVQLTLQKVWKSFDYPGLRLSIGGDGSVTIFDDEAGEACANVSDEFLTNALQMVQDVKNT